MTALNLARSRIPKQRVCSQEAQLFLGDPGLGSDQQVR
jgi:hypothetical protein